jgi:hypothetical protein
LKNSFSLSISNQLSLVLCRLTKPLARIASCSSFAAALV